MFKALKDAATQLGLRTDEESAESAPAHPPEPPAGSPPPVVTSLQATMPGADADGAVVAQLEAALLNASPIIGTFMKNVEIARTQFPDNENARLRAALAFTGVDKATLVGELNRTVAAALLQAKKSADADRLTAHDAAVGGLAKDLDGAKNEIRDMQDQVAKLQQKISARQSFCDDLQGKIRTAEAALVERENVVKASFSRVEQYVATLKQTFSQL